MKFKDKINPVKGYSERIIAVVFISFVVSISFLFGYLVGKSTIPEPHSPQGKISSVPTPPSNTNEPSTQEMIARQIPRKNVSEIDRSDTEKTEGDLKETLSAIAERKDSSSEHTKKETEKAKEKTLPEKIKRPYHYTVQVGAFKNSYEALSLKDRLQKKGYDVRVLHPDNKEGYYKVRIGIYRTKSEAKTVALKLARMERLKPMVVREHD